MMKMMDSGLKFGRTWVDRIMGKVDKDQGVANAGKVLGIGDDGQVVPVEQSGGGGTTTVTTYTGGELLTAYQNGNVKIGDVIVGEMSMSYKRPATLTADNIVNLNTTDSPLFKIKFVEGDTWSLTFPITGVITKATAVGSYFEFDVNSIIYNEISYGQTYEYEGNSYVINFLTEAIGRSVKVQALVSSMAMKGTFTIKTSVYPKDYVIADIIDAKLVSSSGGYDFKNVKVIHTS